MKRLPVILLALAGLALCFQQLFSRHVVHAEMQSLLISDERARAWPCGQNCGGVG